MTYVHRTDRIVNNWVTLKPSPSFILLQHKTIQRWLVRLKAWAHFSFRKKLFSNKNFISSSLRLFDSDSKIGWTNIQTFLSLSSSLPPSFQRQGLENRNSKLNRAKNMLWAKRSDRSLSHFALNTSKQPRLNQGMFTSAFSFNSGKLLRGRLSHRRRQVAVEVGMGLGSGSKAQARMQALTKKEHYPVQHFLSKNKWAFLLEEIDSRSQGRAWLKA